MRGRTVRGGVLLPTWLPGALYGCSGLARARFLLPVRGLAALGWPPPVPPGRGLASSVLQAHSRGPPRGLALEGRTLASPEQTLNLWPPGEAWLRVGRQRRGPQRVGPFPPERPRLRLGLFTEAGPGPLPACPLSSEGDLNLGCRSRGPSGADPGAGCGVDWGGRGPHPRELGHQCPPDIQLLLSEAASVPWGAPGGADLWRGSRFPTLDTGAGTAAARLVRPLLAPAGVRGVRRHLQLHFLPDSALSRAVGFAARGPFAGGHLGWSRGLQAGQGGRCLVPRELHSAHEPGASGPGEGGREALPAPVHLGGVQDPLSCSNKEADDGPGVRAKRALRPHCPHSCPGSQSPAPIL